MRNIILLLLISLSASAQKKLSQIPVAPVDTGFSFVAVNKVGGTSTDGRVTISNLSTYLGTSNTLQAVTANGNSTNIPTVFNGGMGSTSVQAGVLKSTGAGSIPITTYLGGGSFTATGTSLVGFIAGTAGNYAASNDTAFSISVPYTTAQVSIFLFPTASLSAKSGIYLHATNNTGGNTIFYFKPSVAVSAGGQFSFNYMIIQR
jgi:hypothetical protein